jgi:branched-chain amino acid transport system permease protein
MHTTKRMSGRLGAPKVIGTVGWLCVLLAILSFPLLVRSQYVLHISIVIGLAVIYGMGYNLLFGFCGQVSFGHGGFFAVGAYASVLMVLRLGLSFWTALAIAVLFTGLVGFLLGLPVLKLHHHYLAMATLAFAVIVESVVVQWRELTRGPVGLMGIPVPSFFGVPVHGVSFYYLTFLFVVLGYIVARNVVRSRFGRAILAIKENEEAAPSLGINVRLYKTIALTISALYAGLAGVRYAFLNQFIGPECFTLDLSVTAVLMTVMGGAGTFLGPVVGAVIVSILPELLYGFEEYHLIIYGLVLGFFLLFLPKGIVGGVSDLARHASAGKLRARRTPGQKQP